MTIAPSIDLDAMTIELAWQTSIPSLHDACDLEDSPALTRQIATIQYDLTPLDDVDNDPHPIPVGHVDAFVLDLNVWDRYHAGQSLVQSLDDVTADLTEFGRLLFRKNNTLRKPWETVRLFRPHVILLEYFWIHSAWQDQGIGTAALQRLLTYWHTQAGVVIALPFPITPGTGERVPRSSAASLLPRLHHFYERVGFRAQPRSALWTHINLS